MDYKWQKSIIYYSGFFSEMINVVKQFGTQHSLTFSASKIRSKIESFDTFTFTDFTVFKFKTAV